MSHHSWSCTSTYYLEPPASHRNDPRAIRSKLGRIDPFASNRPSRRWTQSNIPCVIPLKSIYFLLHSLLPTLMHYNLWIGVSLMRKNHKDLGDWGVSGPTSWWRRRIRIWWKLMVRVPYPPDVLAIYKQNLISTLWWRKEQKNQKAKKFQLEGLVVTETNIDVQQRQHCKKYTCDEQRDHRRESHSS